MTHSHPSTSYNSITCWKKFPSLGKRRIFMRNWRSQKLLPIILTVYIASNLPVNQWFDLIEAIIWISYLLDFFLADKFQQIINKFIVSIVSHWIYRFLSRIPRIFLNQYCPWRKTAGWGNRKIYQECCLLYWIHGTTIDSIVLNGMQFLQKYTFIRWIHDKFLIVINTTIAILSHTL